ncbi:sigma-70 family RNA polymerase sigma factor [Streptomyces sp. HUAS CX7]|uniref:sigma-70 family RNA polymerase sigma factor n=1 Tax=Streptomyces sp. HUAS CX7 TaxID=3062782 RepID=UPI0026EFB44C|nr:sigma-70 family RNA polymerase sigma factor [Streptomyces sp. HUAS CX7]WKX23651.1 sigma-70 family RNA polymerase sigma factor [Streptomyces sp. HUAS CX7]
MTTPTDPLEPPDRPRPGRKLGPITDNASSTHRAWLVPMRDTYLASGLTLNALSDRIRFAKSKLSELLRGVGLYPRWEVVFLIAAELGMPNWPLYRLWRQAAFEAQRSGEWVERCTDHTTLTAADTAPPMNHRAFRELTESDYLLYAQVFLDDEERDTAVSDTYDILWLSWNDALTSTDTRRYAWTALRDTVMARTPHRDGRPELGPAAFDTLALRSLTDPADDMDQVPELVQLFTVISHLTGRQFDVMVLRRLCGFTPEAVSALVGASLATVRSDERHATRFVRDVLDTPPSTEGTAP